ncbi:uncharacterized protein LOC117651535 [Thrips palmi]|uniref:Uncharacterized protein LOC117651535 n=1 Tax=Thrips palmi TaxID=161013 RepID=A0A6P9A2J3_THRPL|nr:uncharacterized protein LOC117651535 [Thrips palmi]XP_034251509.1 uncharacterized protein LOC117651535 [Thrips palmi]
MDCNICMKRLDTVERRPKAIPCGHTVCLQCLKGIDQQTCPHCLEAFPGPAEALPDNFFVLGLIEKDQQHLRDLRFWCRDCGKTATEECGDMEHSLCSLRKLRSEQAAAQLQRLQSAATAARKVVQALQDTMVEVEDQLQQWRGRMQQFDEAERELRARVDEDWNDVQAALPDGLEQLQDLQDTASLLQARCTLQVQLRAEGGTLWKGRLAGQRGGGSLLHPLLLHLHQTGVIAKIQKQAVALPLIIFREYWNAANHSTREDHCRELYDLFVKDALEPVKKLDGVDCKKRPTWCKLLLQCVAPRVEWLHLSFALREHLDVIHDMSALRFCSSTWRSVARWPRTCRCSWRTWRCGTSRSNTCRRCSACPTCASSP